MLVLTRKIDESIVIGDDIRLIVVAVHRGHVKIGIEAPKDVRIVRAETAQCEKEVPVTQHLVLRTDGVAIERLTEIRDSLRESLEQKDAVQKQAYQRMEEQKRGRKT